MKIRTEMTLATLLAIGMLAAAFAANASAFNSTQQKFKAEIKGVQTFTSDYDHAATDLCDPAISSHSKESVRFASTKPVTITFTRIPGVKVPGHLRRQEGPEAADEGEDHPLEQPLGQQHARRVRRERRRRPGGPTPPDCGTRTITPWNMTFDYVRKSKWR